MSRITEEKETLRGGLEPPTSRLTVERASQLRHRRSTQILRLPIYILACPDSRPKVAEKFSMVYINYMQK